MIRVRLVLAETALKQAPRPQPRAPSAFPTQPGLPASTGSCTLLSLTSPPSTGACVWRHLAASSAPAPMGPPKASSMCLVTKVLGADPRHGGGGRGESHKSGPTLSVGSDSPPAVPKARISATFGFNPCVNTGCGKPAVRPLVDTGAMVFVVFGILGINRTQQMDNHVIGDPVRPLGAGVEGRGCGRHLRTGTRAWPGGPFPHTHSTPTQLLQPTGDHHRPLRERRSPGEGELIASDSGIWVHLGTHTGCLVFMGGG